MMAGHTSGMEAVYAAGLGNRYSCPRFHFGHSITTLQTLESDVLRVPTPAFPLPILPVPNIRQHSVLASQLLIIFRPPQLPARGGGCSDRCWSMLTPSRARAKPQCCDVYVCDDW